MTAAEYVEMISRSYLLTRMVTFKKRKRRRKGYAGVVETLFDAVYLIFVITIGIMMIAGCKGNKQYRLFGIMAVVLGAGDAFHLVPRAFALCTTGLENFTAALGIGEIYYIHYDDDFLYYFVLCVADSLSRKRPKWTHTGSIWAVYCPYCVMSLPSESVASRVSTSFLGNLPQHSFCAAGLVMIVLFYKSAKEPVRIRTFGICG